MVATNTGIRHKAEKHAFLPYQARHKFGREVSDRSLIFSYLCSP